MVPSNNSVRSDAQRGIFTWDTFDPTTIMPAEWLVQDLVPTRSKVFLVGDSGVGKTPFCLQLALCLATGQPFLGRHVQQSRVLYCDLETSAPQAWTNLMGHLMQHLGLGDLPQNFMWWNPNWDTEPSGRDPGEELYEIVREKQPDIVFVDTFKAFYPAGDRSEVAPLIMSRFRRSPCAWVLIHHLRKLTKEQRQFPPPKLGEDVPGFFNQAAGAMSLINLSDTRLAMERTGDREAADVMFAGFVKLYGETGLMPLNRRLNEDNKPIGYDLAHGSDHLSLRERRAFLDLPGEFTFTEAKATLDTKSPGVVARFLDNCMTLKILEKGTSSYRKLVS